MLLKKVPVSCLTQSMPFCKNETPRHPQHPPHSVQRSVVPMLAQEESIDLKVFYSKKTEQVRFDKDFGQEVTWDVPLTEGYAHESFDAKEKTGRNQLMAAIESFNPSALLVYGWNFDGHLAAMRHFHGSVPVWFRGDSTLLDPLPFWKRTLRKLSLNWVYRFVDRAFYVGQANKRYFLWCGLKEDQLTYAPHAVDNEFFMKDDEKRRQEALKIREDLGIDPDAIVFLFVGKLEPIKQPIELAESFASLDATAHLIFVGSGVLEIELKERFDSNPNIHFVGFQNQSIIPIWYRVGNVLCLPSKSETWGLAVNEALACGCQRHCFGPGGVCGGFGKRTAVWSDHSSAEIKPLGRCDA